MGSREREGPQFHGVMRNKGGSPPWGHSLYKSDSSPRGHVNEKLASLLGHIWNKSGSCLWGHVKEKVAHLHGVTVGIKVAHLHGVM